MAESLSFERKAVSTGKLQLHSLVTTPAHQYGIVDRRRLPPHTSMEFFTPNPGHDAWVLEHMGLAGCRSRSDSLAH